jgi:glycosyltransferase involved in cell wall biosynthesis
LLLPSQWLENHPLTLEYALKLSVPVLVSQVPSLSHLLGHEGIHWVRDYRNPYAWTAAMQGMLRRAGRPRPALRELRVAADVSNKCFSEFVTKLENAYAAASGLVNV